MRTLARSAGGAGLHLLKVWPISGLYPCRNFFSSLSALDAKTLYSSICLPSRRKPMARISAVTALRSYATFLRGGVGATYASTTSKIVAGRLVTCALRRQAQSDAI